MVDNEVVTRLERIELRLEENGQQLGSLDKTMAVFVESAKPCRKQREALTKIVSGNGSIGLRAKMWVVWGLLGLGGAGMVGQVCLADRGPSTEQIIQAVQILERRAKTVDYQKSMVDKKRKPDG